MQRYCKGTIYFRKEQEMWSFSLLIEDIYPILLVYLENLQYFCKPIEIETYYNKV